MPRLNHFEQVYEDPDKAAEFYQKVFGWKVEKWEAPEGASEYWMVTTGPDSELPGINGGFMKPRDENTPKVMNTIAVDDIDAYLEKAKAAGAEIHMDKMKIPGIGYQAYVKDPGGVMIGLHQTDMEVK